MSRPHPLATELKQLFSDFQRELPASRKSMLPCIKSLALSIKSQSGNSYVSQKCTSLFVCCENLARLRQPKWFDENREIVLALGDISKIQENFSE